MGACSGADVHPAIADNNKNNNKNEGGEIAVVFMACIELRILFCR